MTEEWRPVPGYEGLYSAGSLGTIRREASTIRIAAIRGGSARLPQRIVSKRVKANGYVLCDLWMHGKVWTVHVHTLVALAFLGPPPPGHQVNHKNSDKSDNRLENLEYLTALENKTHAIRHGNWAHGTRHHRAQLSEEAVRIIRATSLRPPGTMRALAHQYGVSPVTIGKVHRRETWKHLP